MPLKSATTSTTRANPAKDAMLHAPVAGEITIRQPQEVIRLLPADP